MHKLIDFSLISINISQIFPSILSLNVYLKLTSKYSLFLLHNMQDKFLPPLVHKPPGENPQFKYTSSKALRYERFDSLKT
jgi:hypothetical protein